MSAPTQTTAIVVAKPDAVLAAVQERRELIEALLEGTPMTYQRFLQVILFEVNRNPQVQECELLTVVGAVVQAAQLGLEVGSTRRECDLVPFWSEKRRRKECQLIIRYGGKEELARRSGLVKQFFSGVVCERDEYAFGHMAIPAHKRASYRRADRGKIVCAWASAVFFDGSIQSVEIDLDRIDRAKSTSKGKETFWVKDEFAMVEKTAIHELCKHLSQVPLPVNDRLAARNLARVADLEALAAEGQSQDLGQVLDADFREIAPGEGAAEIVADRWDGTTVDVDTGEVTPWAMTTELWEGLKRDAASAQLRITAFVRELGLPARASAFSREDYLKLRSHVDLALAAKDESALFPF